MAPTHPVAAPLAPDLSTFLKPGYAMGSTDLARRIAGG